MMKWDGNRGDGGEGISRALKVFVLDEGGGGGSKVLGSLIN